MAKVVKSEFPAERWNKKRLMLAFIILAALIFGVLQLKSYMLDDSMKEDVRGVSSATPAPTISLPSAQTIGQELEQNINNIKEEINNLNMQDLATSSPQVQKVLEDIKSLPSYPASQAKQVCLNICNNL